MRLSKRIAEKLRREIKKRVKFTKQLANAGKAGDRSLVFVAGCQRSGTSMMYKTFDRDPNAAIYDEVSRISNQDKVEGLRLNPLTDVKKCFDRNPAKLIVAKPLVESQRLRSLLDYFDSSKSIWMYRHYSDVVNSNLRRFGDSNGYSDIKPIINRDMNNWRAQGLSEETLALFDSIDLETTNKYDAAALFWYARNSLYFEQNLNNDKRVFICKYESLVCQPAKELKRIYEFIGCVYPGDKLAQGIFSQSVGKGSTIAFSPLIEKRCGVMMEMLDNALNDALLQ